LTSPSKRSDFCRKSKEFILNLGEAKGFPSE
jgi:hypothetical protein